MAGYTAIVAARVCRRMTFGTCAARISTARATVSAFPVQGGRAARPRGEFFYEKIMTYLATTGAVGGSKAVTAPGRSAIVKDDDRPNEKKRWKLRRAAWLCR